MQKNLAIGILAFLLLGAAAGNVYFYTKNKQIGKNSAEGTQFAALKDSLQSVILAKEEQLTKLQGELVAAQNSQETSQNSSGDLTAQIANLKAELVRARKGIVYSKDPKQLKKYQAIIDSLNNDKSTLGLRLQMLEVDRDRYKTQFEDANESLTDAVSTKKRLEDRINTAKTPILGPIIISGVYTKKGQQANTTKAKSVEKFKVEFDLLENTLIDEPLETDVVVRIIGPQGEILTNSNPDLTDKSELFTIKETVVFDGSQHHLKFFYAQKPFKKGKYKVELIHAGVIKHETNIVLN